MSSFAMGEKRGIAYVSEIVSPEGTSAGFAVSRENDTGPLGSLPPIPSLEDAVEWARERAPRVIVRIGLTSYTFYDAGDIEADREPRPDWPCYRWAPGTPFSDGSPAA